MKIFPFFFPETLAERAAVVHHTRMYDDRCLNNLYIMYIADKNDARTVYHQRGFGGLMWRN